MTRDQAKAIVINFDLIRHFAEGGEIAHRLIDCKGEQVGIYPTDKIVLSNMSPYKHCLYVKVKPRFRFDSNTGNYIHHKRYWPEKIKDYEILNTSCC